MGSLGFSAGSTGAVSRRLDLKESRWDLKFDMRIRSGGEFEGEAEGELGAEGGKVLEGWEIFLWFGW